MTWHPDTPEEYRNTIVTGDARTLAERIPSESVDLIFTDPPYPREYLPLYGWLAETAARVLKPGGSLVTQLGQMYLPLVLDHLRAHLAYQWTFCFYQSNPASIPTIWPRRTLVRWKPLFWFVKGEYAGRLIQDGIINTMPDKRFHIWGQPENVCTYWIDAFTRTDPGATIADFFGGGGTTAAVCKMLNRNYLAFEIDPATAERARLRVEQTQAMHPVLLGAQEPMELAV